MNYVQKTLDLNNLIHNFDLQVSKIIYELTTNKLKLSSILKKSSIDINWSKIERISAQDCIGLKFKIENEDIINLFTTLCKLQEKMQNNLLELESFVDNDVCYRAHIYTDVVYLYFNFDSLDKLKAIIKRFDLNRNLFDRNCSFFYYCDQEYKDYFNLIFD